MCTGIRFYDPSGEFIAVIGKSGSGKSTLLNMIAGIDHPTSGEVMVNGSSIHQLSEGQVATWRGRNVGLVFQFFQLIPTLTTTENVMLPMDFCNMYSDDEREQRAKYLLGLVSIAEQADKLPSALSGGEQQRVAIARALANDPPLIVADEPTGNLDSKTAAIVFDLFRELVRKGKTVLMVPHDKELARSVPHKIEIVDGRISRNSRGDQSYNKQKRSDKMIRKIIGTILLVIGGFFIVVLATGGGPVFPHIVGPTTVAVVGVVLLALKTKPK